ncbi:DNA-binding SARP family transcriptional activator [Nocardia transvalensis]|uniref:DNA-binding SARP family transcriptional activator n=1 Tax=Nocardia transvalensis TaxID=37333 RepID=A0A7W9PCG3_9NOCA|nr:BTAD domain-containing putative transcriptional regulator [Nocardia transvalensis]MBB5913371.1 DNA-binding SARP family transcriptional activator [Nocardia transvalensis]
MLKFAVLGEVRAWRGENPLDLGPKQRRAVLAALLLRRGRSATVPELVGDVWGERATASAVGALRNHILHLRKTLEPERHSGAAPAVLVGFAGGYALRLPPAAVDVELAEQYATEAERSADAGRARSRLQDALALWAGTPLSGLPGPHAERLRTQLVERRLSLLEQRLEADLRLGRHAEAIAELRPLAAEHPLREKTRELLMAALYHAGRQAEALEVFADTRRTLVDLLGIEPGPRLTDLHQRILRSELAPPRAAAVAEEMRVAQLPADIADFTGRDDCVRRMVDCLTNVGGAVPVCAVAGMGGVGKSTLAVHVAHLVREHFPDGQLHVDLHGFERRISAADTLGDFLRALGVPEGEIPATAQQRAARFRSRLDGRRVLVVLDNARDAEQVAPLIPGTPGSAVLITSRSALPELSGAVSVRLDEMSTAEASTLLAHIVGAERVAAEAEAAEAVVRGCGRLPLAVRIVGARLASRPRWTIADVADRFADAPQRLGLLRTGDLAVGSVFQLGYDQLEPQQARAFRLLAVPEVEDLPLPGAAAVLGLDRDEVEYLCESLVDLSLLDATAAGRYTHHDLLRLFARELGPLDEAEALPRLLDFYLATTKNVVAVCNPGTRLPEYLKSTRAQGLSFADGADAQCWLDSERRNLVALFRQAARVGGPALALSADLAWAMAELIDGGPNAQELARALEELLAAALCAGDRGLECRVRVALGSVLTYALARMRTGRDHQRIALSLGSDSAGDARLTAFAAQLLASSTRMGVEIAASLAHAERARRLARRVGDPATECVCLIHAAKTLSDAGRYEESVESAEAGLELARQIGNDALAGMALHELGAALAYRDEFVRAIELCTRAVEFARRSGMRLRVGFALARLAHVHMLAGRLAEAEPIAAEAVENITRAAGPLHRGRVMLLHGLVLQGLGRGEEARHVLRGTAEIVAQLEDADLVQERVDEELEAPVMAILREHLDAVLAERAD